MLLERVRVVGLGPFEAIELDLCERPGEPRALTVLAGDGGTGKSTLLAAVSATRPGNHVVQTSVYRRPGTKPQTVCHWRLAAEDPERPHALVVATPGTSAGADDKAEQLRRREVVHFDRELAAKGGFAFVGIPGTRRFPRANLVIGDPARTILRQDTRGAPGFQDASGVDLTRAVKLILAYAKLSSALAGDRRGEAGADPRSLGAAIDAGMGELLAPVGHLYRGLDPRTFEPRFETPTGELLPFDALAMQVRQLVAIVALSTHQLWVAHRGADPRECEGVVLIDDVDLHLSAGTQLELLPRLRRVLPRVQWVVSTNSPVLAHSVSVGELVTLRRDAESARIQAYEGELSLTH